MQIRLLDSAAAQTIYETYMVQDFPAAELKPFSAVREMMQAGIYEPLVFCDDDGALLAYAWQVLLPGRRSALHRRWFPSAKGKGTVPGGLAAARKTAPLRTKQKRRRGSSRRLCLADRIAHPGPFVK